MKMQRAYRPPTPGDRRRGLQLITAALALLAAGLPWLAHAQQAAPAQLPATLDESRQIMSKWIETQRLISKERKDWEQGKEVLQGRLELMRKEVVDLQAKIQEADKASAEAEQKRQDALKQNEQVKAVGVQLADSVAGMESDTRKLYKALPDHLKTKLQPLFKRIPEDAVSAKASVAERYQNVLGILNEVNKANNDITVNYEVHNNAAGKPVEVEAIYLGLGQAYFVATNEAGICQPTLEGWVWKSDNTIASQVAKTLEIIQGKQTPAFVPLPVKIQ